MTEKKRMRYTDEQKEKVIAEVKGGKSAMSVAKEHQISYPTILSWLRGAGRGGKSSINKMFRDLVAAIRAEEAAKYKEKLRKIL